MSISRKNVLDEVPYIHRPANVSEKQALLPVIPSYKRRDPLVVLHVPPRRQHHRILKPLGIEARKLKVDHPKFVPLTQNQISGREV